MLLLIAKDYSSGLHTTLPTSHAGHQIHQITTWVQSPWACQPKAASTSTSSTLTPQALQTASITTEGDNTCSNTLAKALRVLPSETECSDDAVEKGGPTKERGAASNPMRNASEKFSVARVARNIPSRSSEKHCRRRRCCAVNEVWRDSRTAKREGNERFTSANESSVRERACENQ